MTTTAAPSNASPSNALPSAAPPSIRAAESIVSALLNQGVKHFAYCPGSRNAPFAYVLEAYETRGLLHVHPFAEERGAGFWALGLIKATGEPACVVTTSGTAVAELHPAMEEAHHQGLPLLALTADRPFEAHGVGANQTTEQLAIFAGAPVAELNVPAFDRPSEPLLAKLSARVIRTVMRACGMPGLPGPAHINVAFREPLVPSGDISISPRVDGVQATPQVFAENGSTRWEEVVDPDLRTLLVVGDVGGARERSDVRSLAQYAAQLGIPMLAEPSSGACDVANWLPHGPLIAALLGAEVEQIIVLGRPTLSRPVARLLAGTSSQKNRADVPQVRKIVVGESEDWPDSEGNATVYVERLVPDQVFAEMPSDKICNEGWRERCVALAQGAARGLADALAAETATGNELNQLSVAREIWQATEPCALWLGASGAVRAFDLAAGKPGNALVYANRGLAGIDGTIASALGLQFGIHVPVRVVLGDLTFCYDLPSLAARPDGPQDIQAIVLDDGGGSIFASLEHGRVAGSAMYDRFFRVPQNIDVLGVASACGWTVYETTDVEKLRQLLRQPIRGRSVIRVSLRPADQLVRRILSEPPAG